MKYLISIIVPVYNNDKYLHNCINSIINQTYRNIEIILIDDGSTDTSLQVCNFYSNKDKRIKVIHKENGGLSEARNYGIKHAKGDYIFFIDSDDIIQNNTIEIMYSVLENKNDCISICNFERFNSKYSYSTNKIIKKYTSLSYFEEILKINCFTYACGVLIPKSFLNTNFFIKGRYFEDMSSMYKIFSKSKYIYKFDGEFYKYRTNLNSIVHTMNNKKIEDYIKSTNEMLEFIDSHYNINIKLQNVFKCEVLRTCYILTKDDKYLNKAKKLVNNVSYKDLSLKNIIKIFFLNSKILTKILVKIKN